jgi:hypothetical protein
MERARFSAAPGSNFSARFRQRQLFANDRAERAVFKPGDESGMDLLPALAYACRLRRAGA